MTCTYQYDGKVAFITGAVQAAALAAPQPLPLPDPAQALPQSTFVRKA